MSQRQTNLENFFTLNPHHQGLSVQNPNENRQQARSSIIKEVRLPHHTKKLWQFAKGLLYFLAIKQSCSVEGILEVICKLISECRIIHSNDIDISVLRNFLTNNDNPEILGLFSKIASYALEVEFLFPEPIPILTKHSNGLVNLSYRQIRCLLALQFYCCFPKQETNLDLPKDYTYAKIFNKSHASQESQTSKIICALNYFRRQEFPEELYVAFIRKSIQQKLDWSTIDLPLTEVYSIADKYGTEDYRDKIMIDFANKYIGGGVLGSGTVQEEIMFHKHVQPIASVIFTEKLEDEETLFFKGTQRFNKTDGYKSSFKFVDDFNESLFLDDYGRNDCYISAIDANYYGGNESSQYLQDQIARELHKAYVGFSGDTYDMINRDVVSGRWGCGAFGGDENLKFIIQWLAASACQKELYFLLWDMNNPHELQQFINICKRYKVSQLFTSLLKARKNSNLFASIISLLSSLETS
ncbi:hypothetical protein SteCoe_34332 [Stentor coeruleus]|uniref:poly(ADP-ribose) glycohydrolase n=1 Tax=Stentor coeruleus TaxID=5963 RepID=A0A1R2AUS0_9CILI|nr:hypothetical protein SteCoe_34332 [Stentor coeruleus]